MASATLLGGAAASGESPSGAYSFLELPVSSHVSALGGAGAALVDADVMLVESNPALLGAETGRQAAAGYVNWMGSTNLVGLRYGQSAGCRGAWAAGLRWLDRGEFEGYDEQGTPTGSFRATDFVAEGTYSHDFTAALRGGITVKTVVGNYESFTAVALGVDLGLNLYDAGRDESLSVVVRNLGGQLKRFDGRRENLPADLAVAWMKGLGESGFVVALQASRLTDWSNGGESLAGGTVEVRKRNAWEQVLRHLQAGLQYEPTGQFYVAVGYDYRTRSDMAGYGRTVFSGFTAGAGLNAGNFMAGVAVSQPHKRATGVTLNLAYDFGSLMK